jgi:hypothetical protein
MFHILEHEAMDEVPKSSGRVCEVYDEDTLQVRYCSTLGKRRQQQLCMQSSQVIALALNG